MSLSQSVNVKKQWGWFNGNCGYFFQIKANGSGDNFSVIRRTNFGTITEEETVRSAFNGNKLNNLDFTNITMFGIEVGTVGGLNARFWAFILGKWVLIHSLSNAGTLQNPAINEIALPIAFNIINTSPTSDTQTLFRYGVSVANIGEIADDNTPNEISVTKDITTTSNSTWVLFGIRGKPTINDIQNCNILLPLALKVYAGGNLINLFLLKNPEIDPTLAWTALASSGIEFNTSRYYGFTKGNKIPLAVSATSGTTISLNKIFSLQRDFGSTRFTNDAQLPTDTGLQSAQEQDIYWVCATFIGSTPVFSENKDNIIWDLLVSQNVSLSGNPTTSKITASLSFMEV